MTSGRVSLSSSSRFPPISGERFVMPGMLPPGRARVAMRPDATGSLIEAETIAIVLDALFAARTPGVETVTMTFTLSRAKSLAKALKPSVLPSA